MSGCLNSNIAATRRLPGLVLSALGVVFGDIGTSPLYTLKTVLSLADNPHSPELILGLLSMIIWTMVIVTSLKYALCVMRIDNHGEGGILALMSLLIQHKQARLTIVMPAIFGAALLYGDGAITPAISVLSALEGLNIAIPGLKPYILPLAVVILIVLFILQHAGSTKIGRFFGPVMSVWFITMAMLGIHGITQYPGVLLAVNPWYALNFIMTHGGASFLILSGVFLCVTGAEALYADMGYFGRKSIWIAWFTLAFPCLLLNYTGQAALAISGVALDQNIFYLLCPPVLLIPLIILATLATIIASQAVISSAFSMARQAIQLGWLPPLKIKQTSEDDPDQVYIGSINMLLMVTTLLLALFFRTSENLASAYGIAVSLTMTITSLLLFRSMREIWSWSLIRSLYIAGFFLIIDIIFLMSNMNKFVSGGYIPLFLAGVVFSLMLIWHKGNVFLLKITNERMMSIFTFLRLVEEQHIPRVPGSAIFLARYPAGVPSVMKLHVRRNGSLQQKILLLTIHVENIPFVNESDRVTLNELVQGTWRCKACFGFMEHPDIPRLLGRSEFIQCLDVPERVTYYIGHETLILREKNRHFPEWQRKVFRVMKRNSAHITDYYYLPGEQVVELNRIVTL